MENNELYHFGIKGMKWGVRRYQNEDGSLTDEGRSHYGYGVRARLSNAVNVIKTKHQAKVELKKKEKVRKEKLKRLEAARKAKAEKKAYEEGKKKAIESGSAEEVMKYKDSLTTEEKNRINSRLQADANLARFAREEAAYRAEQKAKNSVFTKINNVASAIGKASTSIDNVAKGYNSAAKVINAFSDSKLPIIGDAKKIDTFKKSKALASDLLSRSGDMSVRDIENELTRIDAIYRIESFSAGDDKGVKKQYSSGNDPEDKEDKKKKKKEDE